MSQKLRQRKAKGCALYNISESELGEFDASNMAVELRFACVDSPQKAVTWCDTV